MPQIDADKVIRFAAAGDEISSLDVLSRAARDAVAHAGVTSIAVNLIAQPGRDRRPGVLLAEAEWSAWARRYARLKHERHDPALRMLREQARPFTWTEARRRFHTPEAERVMDSCREFTGLGDALVVPVRDADGALLSVTFAAAALELDAEGRSALLLAGFFYATRSRELLSGFELDAACPLTARQLDCLFWVHRGKNDREIGSILEISPYTVHNHIESAKRILDVPKRSQASLEAWRRGWIN